jgi:hypothetical protein
LNSGSYLSHSTSPFLWWEIGSRTICLDWLQTVILLISASWVARITGVSHRHPATLYYFYNVMPCVTSRLSHSESKGKLHNDLETLFRRSPERKCSNLPMSFKCWMDKLVGLETTKGLPTLRTPEREAGKLFP